MPSIQEISFYEDCAHTENRVYANCKTREEINLPLPPEVPIIDHEVFIGTLEKGFNHDALEVHYRENAKCPTCKSNQKTRKLKKLSEDDKNKRRTLWHNFADTFELVYKNALCMAERAIADRDKIDALAKERPNDDNRFQMRIQMIVARQLVEETVTRKKLYEAFDTMHHAQCKVIEHRSSRLNLLAPGYDTLLLSVAEDPKPEDKDDRCGICLLRLYEEEGRPRSLPCGHKWHHSCISAWLNKAGTCPMCRVAYSVLDMPGLTDKERIRKFEREMMQTLATLTSGPFFLGKEVDRQLEAGDGAEDEVEEEGWETDREEYPETVEVMGDLGITEQHAVIRERVVRFEGVPESPELQAPEDQAEQEQIPEYQELQVTFFEATSPTYLSGLLQMSRDQSRHAF